MSRRFSTHDDEVVFLAYRYPIGQDLAVPFLKKAFTLDESNRSQRISVSEGHLSSTETLIVLLERDSDIGVDELERKLRLHFQEIHAAHQAKNYRKIQDYLDDDDVIGIKVVTESDMLNPLGITFRGIHKMDRYQYLLEFR